MSKKRRGHGEGSVYQRSDGRWCATITMGYENGKRRRVARYAATQEEAIRELHVLQSSKANGERPADGRLTVAAFLDEWLDRKRARGLKPSTLTSYEMHVRKHLAPAIGAKRLRKLSVRDVDAMVLGLMKKPAGGRRTGTLSPRSVQYSLSVLRNALGDAVRLDLVPRNVAKLVRPPEQAPKTRAALTADQASDLVRNAAGTRFGHLFTVAIATGMRRGELLALRWDDVDLAGRSLAVSHSLFRPKGGGFLLVPPKTKSGLRTIPLPAPAVAALRAQRAEQGQARLLAGTEWADHGFVFTTRSGTPVDGPAVSREYGRVATECGISGTSFHSLRHTCATLLAANGVNPAHARHLLGHANIQVTLQYYTKPTDDALRAAADGLSSVLGG